MQDWREDMLLSQNLAYVTPVEEWRGQKYKEVRYMRRDDTPQHSDVGLHLASSDKLLQDDVLVIQEVLVVAS